ncbi:MAG: hypothetical protein NVS1B7_0790 [Candidatus Saccharimonadales bacterium]
MNAKKYRWSRTYESAEEELVDFLADKNIIASRWSAAAETVYPSHVHTVKKQLWCAEGSIQFNVGGTQFSLQAGDALEIPANFMHEATVGLSGVVCFESPPSSSMPTQLM